jgi:transglutaminase-like putative cysteine protease
MILRRPLREAIALCHCFEFPYRTRFRHDRLQAGMVFAILLLTVAMVPRARGEAGGYGGPEFSQINAAKAQAAASEFMPAKYPNCDQATIEEKSVRVYRADGTRESQDESYVKVLTEKGRREKRTLRFGFMLPYSTVAVAALELVKPDGHRVAVDVAANSKESIDDSQMSANIYDPNVRVLSVNIPKLEIGDLVHVVVRETTQRAIMPGEFADENLFEGTGYIRHVLYEVHAPAGHPLRRIGLRDAVEGTVKNSVETNADKSLTYRWEINNVPRMFNEPAMPPPDSVLQRLYVSTAPDWKAVSKWYWELSQEHLGATTSDMKQAVSKLTAGAATDTDKIHALFYYVSKNVRYMGLTPEKDRPGFEPHDVCTTFEKKYGVCRDKAALLVSFLRLAGFKAYPVLIAIGAKRDAEVPDPFFDHAIVAVELKKGDYVLMDPTDENTRDLLPSSDCDRTYLVCRAEGEDLRTSPVPPVDQHLMRVKTTGVLTASGRLEAKSELSFEGINDDAYRNAFARMKPDDEERFFEGFLKQAMPGAKLKSLKLTPANMLDMSTTLRAQLEFSAEGLATTGGGKAVVSMPWIGKHFGIVNFLLHDAGLEKRKYPLRTGVTCGMTEAISLKLADGFAGAAAMPQASSVHDESVDYRQEIAVKDGALDASRDLKLKVVEFSPQQYLNLKQTLKKMDYDGRKDPILATTSVESSAPAVSQSYQVPVASDARILQSSRKLEVIDPHTATYTMKYSKRILNYNGKLKEAEVKIHYNPACQEVKIIQAVVISRTGERKEIAAGEMNVMDQGWNPAAKRYTGGKILVANLPGVEIGSTIEVEYAVTQKHALFLGGYEPFELRNQLDRESFELTAPANVKVQKLIGGAGGVITETNQTNNDRQSFQWSAKDVKALPAESQLPPEWNYASGVGYFIGDAGDYFKSLNAAMVEHSEKSTRAAAAAHQLADHARSQLEAVKLIRDFIAKSIRVAGPSFTDLPLSELSDADTTLSDGYGHLADRAILFHAMLTAAGLHPQFVLASGLPPIDGITNVAKALPLLDEFATPLVKVSVDGQDYYLNDTDQYAQLGTVAANGKLGIVLSSQSLQTIAAVPDCQNKTSTTYAMALTDNGKARITISKNYYGLAYNAKHRYFAELPPEERDRYHQKIVSDVVQGAVPVGDLTTQFDAYPGREEFTAEVDNYGVVDGKYFYFDLPFKSASFTSGADRRALPMFIPSSAQMDMRAEVTLPPGFHKMVIAPGNEDLALPGGTTVHIAATGSDGKFIISNQLKLMPAIINPQLYPAMIHAEATMKERSATLLLLEHE